MTVDVTANHPAVVDGLDVNEVKDGLVVYDPKTDRVHYLNATASIVFSVCDGAHDRADIARIVGTAFSLDEPPVDDVDECLATFEREGLLQ